MAVRFLSSETINGSVTSSNFVVSDGTDNYIQFDLNGKNSPFTGQSKSFIFSGQGASGDYLAGTLNFQSRSSLDRDINFITGATPAKRLTISGSGNVSLNDGLLGFGNASSTPNIGYGMFHYSGVGLGIYASASGATQGIGFWLNNGSAYEAGRWLSSGNLGIGTTSPTTAKLVVAGAANTYTLRLDANTTTGQSYGARFRAGTNSSDKSLLVENTSASELFSIRGDGLATFAGDVNISGGNVQIGSGHNTASAGNAVIFASYGSGTNIAGGELQLYGGRSTGSAAGGSIKFYTSPTGSSGSSANSHIQALLIDSSQNATFAGNVGINGSLSAWDSAFDVLQISGITSLFTESDVASKLTNNIYYSSGNKYYTNGQASAYAQQFGTHIWQTASFGTANGAATLSTRMIIDNSGNVGIGTTSPGTVHGVSYGTTKLHVDGGTDRGQMIIEGDSLAGIAFSDNGATANQRVFYQSVDGGLFNITPLNDNGTSTASSGISMLHNGNIGIGTTNPVHLLDVSGRGAFGDIGSFRTFVNGTGAGSFIEFGTNVDNDSLGALGTFSSAFIFTTNQSLGFKWQQGGSDKMRLTSGGDLGIGTASPGAKLHVAGNSHLGGNLHVATDGSFNTSASYTFRDGVFINNPNSTSAVVSNSVMALGASSGNPAFTSLVTTGAIGIGTSTPSKKLHVYNTAAADVALFESTQAFSTLAFKSSSNTDTAVFGVDGGGNAYIENKKSTHPILFTTNSNERMRIDSSGNVGIGTTSPSSKLNLYHATDDVSINVNTGTGGSYPKKTGISFGAISTSLGGDAEFKGGAGIQAINTAASGNPTDLTFWTNSVGTPAERMRITSAGRVLINNTNTSNDAMCHIGGNANNYALYLYADVIYASGYRYQRFRSGGNIAGGIEGSNQTSVVYNTSSDYRMKKNIKPLENGLERLSKLKPVKFDWKLNDESTEGFIAHEVQEIFPDAISGEKDGKEMQGMDYGRITPLLVAAIQELKAEIEKLKNK